MNESKPPVKTDRRFAVETWNLSKSFKGSQAGDQQHWMIGALMTMRRWFDSPAIRTVVNDVSLSVERGELFGLVGSNGAGKTTLLKLLSCLLYPDSGGGAVNGYDLLRQRKLVRRSVVISKAQGWLGMLWQLTGRENLLFRARMCGLAESEAKQRTEYILERLGLNHKANSHSWECSMGEMQKFNLAATFIARTPLVILDEPTSHLDPHVARLIREFVKQDLNTVNGQTVIMSTHYLEEAELMCGRVAILQEGKLLACDTVSSLKRTYMPSDILELRATNYSPSAGDRVKKKCGVVEMLEKFDDAATGQVRLRPKWSDPKADVELLSRELQAEGVNVKAIRRVNPTLDDVYFQLTKERIQ